METQADLDRYREAIKEELDRVRNTAKWMATALGVIASVLIAGVDLSNLGALGCDASIEPDSASDCVRLWLALGSGVVAILASFIAITLLIRVLLPQDWTMKDFATLRSGHRVVKWFRQHSSFLDLPTEVQKDHPLKWFYDDVQKRRRESGREEQRRQTIRQDRVLWTARYVMLRHLFWRGTLPYLILLGFVIAIALITLSWAAAGTPVR